MNAWTSSVLRTLDGAILVFSAHFGAVFFCFNFGFGSTTYVRPLSHLSLLFFVTFVFFILRWHLLFFINSCALSYYLSFLLLDEVYLRNVVNSTACYSTVFCSLTYVNTFHPRLIAELLLFFALRCSHSRLLCALRCCLLLFQLCLPFNYLRPSAFSTFSTGFCHFRIFHTSFSPLFHSSLSPFFLQNLMRFLVLSFIPLTWRSLWAKRC